jgi:hypothetical protein
MPSDPQDISIFPDAAFNLLNEPARALLVSLGLYGRFEHAADVTVPDPGVAIVYYEAHPSHWLMATFTCRFPEAEENGYAVQCLPKAGFSRDRAMQVFDGAKQKLAPGKHTVFVNRQRPAEN